MSDPRLESVRRYRHHFLAERIMKKAVEQSAARQKGNPLRLSNAGACARKLAMQKLNWEARERGEAARFSEEDLQPRALLVFHLGDLIEESLKHWISRCDDLLYGSPGKEVYLPLVVDGKTYQIPGHLDGLVQEPGQTMMLANGEIKSINDKGFDRLDREGPDYGYICQAHAYMKALGLQRTRILYMNKNSSALDEWVIEFSEELMAQVEKRFAAVIRATDDALPDREYQAEPEVRWVAGHKGLIGISMDQEGREYDSEGKRILERKRNGYWRETGRKILGWNCSYCPLKAPCWGDGLQADLSGDKPVWFVNSETTRRTA